MKGGGGGLEPSPASNARRGNRTHNSSIESGLREDKFSAARKAEHTPLEEQQQQLGIDGRWPEKS